MSTLVQIVTIFVMASCSVSAFTIQADFPIADSSNLYEPSCPSTASGIYFGLSGCWAGQKCDVVRGSTKTLVLKFTPPTKMPGIRFLYQVYTGSSFEDLYYTEDVTTAELQAEANQEFSYTENQVVPDTVWPGNYALDLKIFSTDSTKPMSKYYRFEHVIFKNMNNSKNFEKYRLASPKDISIYCKPDDYNEIFMKSKLLKCKTDSFLLPPLERFCSTSLWKVPELEFLKSELIRVKSLLNSMKISEWHSHTRNSNPLSSVIKRIRKSVTHEFCSVAWCKLFEILSCHNALPDTVQEAAYQLNEISLDSVHLCEAPGAFISALHHYLQTFYGRVNWNWLATTLNPYYEGNSRSETLIQDQIILSTIENWTFFDEDTGNIMKSQNILSLKNNVEMKGLKSVQLITADGSVDCADAPDEQENITMDLHYCEMMAALEILDRGGTFILKLFTFFECNTICKLFILSCFFDEVQIVKPAMSKEGNSEVYMICRWFVGPEFLTKEKKFLLELCDRPSGNVAIFPMDAIPTEFIRRVVECSHFYATMQADVIVRNVKTYNKGREYYLRMRHVKEALADHWFEATQLTSLPQDKFLLRLDKVKQRYYFTYTTAWDQFDGSYNERINRFHNKNQPQWLEDIKSDYDLFLKEFNLATIKTPLPSNVHCNPKYGKPYEEVKCSRFCSDKILQLFRSYVEYQQTFSLDSENCCSSCTNLNNIEPEEPPVRVLCFSRKFKLSSLLDFIKTVEYLKELWSLLNELLPSQSLFLCNVPLLSRLGLGFVMISRVFFQEGILQVQPEGNSLNGLQGILLKQFVGQNANKKLWGQMTDLSSALSSISPTALPSQCPLELVPITVACARKLCRDVTQYNNHLLLKHLSNSLQVEQT